MLNYHGETYPVSTTTSVSAPQDESTLQLVSPLGATLRINHQLLRSACLCAHCRARRMRGEIRLVDADVSVVAVIPMHYGVQLIFSDGHDRGIFPWRYLHELAGA